MVVGDVVCPIEERKQHCQYGTETVMWKTLADVAVDANPMVDEYPLAWPEWQA